MSSINIVIQEALKEINFEEIAKEAAIGKVKEAVREAVKSQFSHYSGFSKSLDDHIKKELGIDFSTIKLPSYRDFVVDSINTTLASFTTKDQAKEISDYINTKVVGETRNEIEFHTFWDELCEAIKSECDEQDSDKYNVVFGESKSSYSSREYHDLTISLKKDDYSYGPKDKSEIIYAAFSSGVIFHMRDNDGMELTKIYTWLKALKFRKTKVLNPGSEECNIPSRDW